MLIKDNVLEGWYPCTADLALTTPEDWNDSQAKPWPLRVVHFKMKSMDRDGSMLYFNSKDVDESHVEWRQKLLEETKGVCDKHVMIMFVELGQETGALPKHESHSFDMLKIQWGKAGLGETEMHHKMFLTCYYLVDRLNWDMKKRVMKCVMDEMNLVFKDERKTRKTNQNNHWMKDNFIWNILGRVSSHCILEGAMLEPMRAQMQNCALKMNQLTQSPLNTI